MSHFLPRLSRTRVPALGLALAAGLIIGCESTPPMSEGPSFTDVFGSWVAVEIDGQEVTGAGRPPSLDLRADGTASGWSGVNALSTAFDEEALLDGAISFSPAAMTRRAGPPEEMARETAFVKALGEVDRWGFEDGRLALRQGSTDRIVLRPAE